jgi:sugar (pentulose or hexulose) kinase
MKAAIVDQNGRLQAFESCNIQTLNPFDGASEANLQMVWETLTNLTNSLSQKNPAIWKQLAGLCVTGQGDGCWPLDSSCRPVRNALLWNDTRTRQMQDALSSEIEQYCQEHSLTQLFPGAAPLQLLWMKQFEPELFKQVRHVLHCKDWLNYCLTGELTTDFSDASTSLMNIRSGQYDLGLLDLLGIPETAAMFPAIFEAGTTIGFVTREAFNTSGIPLGLPVFMGGIDVSVVAAGAGVTHPGEALSIIGTTLCNEVVLADPQDCQQNTQGSILRHVIPTRYLRLMAASNGISSINWARNFLAPGIAFETIESEISRIQTGCEGVMFQPYLQGERAPFRNPNARGGFFGLSTRHSPIHMLRSVYEGLVLSTIDCYRNLPAVQSIVATGGGANSSLLCQMMADGLGLPVYQVKEAELGIQGAFFLMHKGLELTDQVQVLSREGYQQYDPDPNKHDQFSHLYELFVELRQSLNPYWDSRESVFRNYFE